MAKKRRVYLIRYTHETVKQETLSNMKKVKEILDTDIPYSTLVTKLNRAKERTGKQLIRLKDKLRATHHY